MTKDNKKTLVLGASTKAERYSNKATKALKAHGHDVVLIGNRAGEVDGESILTERPKLENLHTLTLYIGPQHQKGYEDYIVSLKPERVIFNPGTENKDLQDVLDESGIPWEEACTLVLLSIGRY